MGNTCPNTGNGGGIGSTDNPMLRLQHTVLSLITAVFTSGVAAVRWAAAVYLVVAWFLALAFVLHALAQYVRGMYRTSSRGLGLRCHVAAGLSWIMLRLVASLLLGLLMAALWPLWLPLALFGMWAPLAWAGACAAVRLGVWVLWTLPLPLAGRLWRFTVGGTPTAPRPGPVPINQRVANIGNAMVALSQQIKAGPEAPIPPQVHGIAVLPTDIDTEDNGKQD